MDRYEHGRRLVRAELVELGVRHARVDVLAEFWWAARCGTQLASGRIAEAEGLQLRDQPASLTGWSPR
jgi:hypothetical protein